MLIDNREKIGENGSPTMFDFFKENIEKGNFDVVSGYFSVTMLALFLQDKFADIQHFRMILGNLIESEKSQKARVNLLSNSPKILDTFSLKKNATDAVKFLKKTNVEIKTYEDKFCHAKAYVYENIGNKKSGSFFTVGSSNFTNAGLKDTPNSNIELNYARTGQDEDFKAIKNWFEKIWNESQTEITDPNLPKGSKPPKIAYRDYVITLIEKLYREYTPYEIYYKILFEWFYPEILAGEQNLSEKKLQHLKESIVWTRLFDFQKQGVLSLIRMLQTYNGAILADAVGLGKTWQALAVIKFFELEGYKTVLLCPKKLSDNWQRYQAGNESIFEQDDFRYVVRFHTDLQEDEEKQTNRLEKPHEPHKTLKRFFQNNAKILFVIDESHNLRNDKSSRYEFLVDKLLNEEKSKNREVKMLLLSATPINTALTDIRNQFKLLARGENNGFVESLKINNLQDLFAQIQAEFNRWQKAGSTEIVDLLRTIPQNFFHLTDSLVVARTRQMIERSLAQQESETQAKIRASLSFPAKQKPINCYHLPKEFGKLDSAEKVINALEGLDFCAYQPAQFIKSKDEWKKEGVLKDEAKRQGFLARMMFFLLVKRLESSWHSFYTTLKNILAHHENALAKVKAFQENKKNQILDNSEEVEESIGKQLEETGEDISQYTLGKKNPIRLADMSLIDQFQKNLEREIKRLKDISENIEVFAQNLEKGKQKDTKLEELVKQIQAKRQNNPNKKVLIFTVFKDTAFYLFEKLKSVFPKEGIGVVSGGESQTTYGYSSSKFEPILEQFAPFTKLYNEGNWIDSYLEKNFPKQSFTPQEAEAERKKVGFEEWKKYVVKYEKGMQAQVEKPIELLIATDCLSEGQNLQDCDCVINYDIHWNPVRLIQRLGRIDRIGSPNKAISGINFWIGENYENALNLKNRVEKRMAIMALAGTETLDSLTDEMQNMMRDNPLISKQEEKMLAQMQLTWDDIEINSRTLSLADFSLEFFRIELREFLLENKKFLEEMPDGVFSGFSLNQEEQQNKDFSSKNLVALLRHRNDKSLHLLILNENSKIIFENVFFSLLFLSRNKRTNRQVDSDIDTGKEPTLKVLAEILQKAILQHGIDETKRQMSAAQTTGFGAMGAFGSGNNATKNYFQSQNFDLIVWETLEK